MLDSLLTYIAPHHCVSCQAEGSVLCSDCMMTIQDTAKPRCFVCAAPTSVEYLCRRCISQSHVDAIWIAGSHEEALKRAIYTYKFERAFGAYRDLTELLQQVTPYQFTTPIVVNIPTINQHIRQRGYDHTALIAREFAKLRHLPYQQLLRRKSSVHQIGADRETRIRQAADMFLPIDRLLSECTILLIDDVVTTGATISAAAKICKQAGAQQVFAAVCAIEPWQKQE